MSNKSNPLNTVEEGQEEERRTSEGEEERERKEEQNQRKGNMEKKNREEEREEEQNQRKGNMEKKNREEEREEEQNQRKENPFLEALNKLSQQRQREEQEDGETEREGESAEPPESAGRTEQEQHQICMIACAPSDAHLSDFEDYEDDDDDQGRGGGDAADGSPDSSSAGRRRLVRRRAHFPYSSGSSPVSSFRMAIRQSRAPSACGKFNESLLGGMVNANEVQSSLCVCTSIRNTIHPVAEAEEAEDEEERSGTAKMARKLPLKEHPVTNEYKISHEIVGIGESGKVMACYHKRSGEKCALKVLRDNARSRRELDLHWSAAQHAHVVSIKDMFENSFDGLKCLLVVVEFMEGGDLLTIFESGGRLPYSEKCVSRIVRQIGGAVQYLHDRNIAHRDIKLENILCSSTLVDQCTFKLADFGFAKRAERDRLMESPCCTPAYVCPEILGRKQYDKSCDIWALGVATYILLCGYPPFYSMQGLPFSPGMRERITRGLFAFPAEEWDEISSSTKKTIAAMLRTDPAERISIEQLMDSELIRPPGQPPSVAPLPPVHSDSSLSDGGFESSAETVKLSSAESGSESHAEGDEGVGGKRRARFFVGSGAKSSLGMPKTMAKQWPRERVYSIQEEVSQALAMMRLGGDFCTVKDLKTVRGNSLLERRRASKGKTAKV